MAAALKFYAGRNGGNNFAEMNGSGLGFYGTAFGASVQIGQYQGKTFITSADGAVQGPEANNAKKLTSASGVSLNGGSDQVLPELTNNDATLNIRFTYDTPVKTQNAVLRIFDRVNRDNDPSGVTCQVAEIVHPWAGGISPSGSATWVNAHGSGVTLPLVSSPGTSGLRPNGDNTTDSRHDWFVALTATPNSIGSKNQFGVHLEMEFL